MPGLSPVTMPGLSPVRHAGLVPRPSCRACPRPSCRACPPSVMPGLSPVTMPGLSPVTILGLSPVTIPGLTRYPVLYCVAGGDSLLHRIPACIGMTTGRRRRHGDVVRERPIYRYQVSFSCSFTTSPMTIIDGGLISLAATVFVRVDTFPT